MQILKHTPSNNIIKYVDPNKIITHKFKLDDINEAMATM